MNERTLRPANIAAAAALIGGMLVVALPSHGPAIAALVLLSIATAAGLRVLISNAPPAWWISPFERDSDGNVSPTRSDDISRMRSALGARRQRIAGAPPLPPGVIRRLQTLLRSALERDGLDPEAAAALDRLGPLSRVVLTTRIEARQVWWHMARPDAHATAAVIDRVLDDLASVDSHKQTSIPSERGVS